MVPELTQQELRDRDKYVVNFAHGAKYQNSAILHCQKQLNKFAHEQLRKKRMEDEGREDRWREWMSGLSLVWVAPLDEHLHMPVRWLPFQVLPLLHALDDTLH